MRVGDLLNDYNGEFHVYQVHFDNDGECCDIVHIATNEDLVKYKEYVHNLMVKEVINSRMEDSSLVIYVK